jgi:hypothetical protein
MKDWLAYFEYNRANRREIPWDTKIELPTGMIVPLIRSLQRFQVGESGEGRHLRKQAATTGDPIYERCIDLFIKEEQEHARLMAGVLKRLDAGLLQSHWSDGCFILLRHLFGLDQELLVLLMPEMIAKRYFRAVHDASNNPVLQAVCGQIMHDEEGHLAFHVDYLQKSLAGMSIVSRFVLRGVWRILFRLSCLVVIVDHGGILREARVSPLKFWWDCGLIFDEVAAAIFSCAPAPKFVRPPVPIHAE